MAKTGAETQRERRDKGKCCSCTKPATHGVRCYDHWIEKKKKDALQIEARKLAGLCATMGCPNPKPADYATCETCREKARIRSANARAKKRAEAPPVDKTEQLRKPRASKKPKIIRLPGVSLYQARKDAGYCGGCGVNPLPPDGGLCLECLEKQRNKRSLTPKKTRIPFDKAYHQRQKEAGWCTLGGEAHGPPVPGHTLCQACLDKKRARHAKNLASTICPREGCGKPKIPGAKYCPDCTKERREALAKQKADKKARGICTHEGCNEPATHDQLCLKHRLEAREKSNKTRQKIRDEAFAAYGGYKCSCLGCPCNLPEQMHLDHINNDGNVHRRRISGHNKGTGLKMYYDLKKAGWPQGVVQPMCAGCNSAKAKSKDGKCPYAGTTHTKYKIAYVPCCSDEAQHPVAA